MCFNKKVIAGLAVVTIGVVLVAPNLLSRALPVDGFHDARYGANA